jgi:iron complex outermembrane recepter protein
MRRALLIMSVALTINATSSASENSPVWDIPQHFDIPKGTTLGELSDILAVRTQRAVSVKQYCNSYYIGDWITQNQFRLRGIRGVLTPRQVWQQAFQGWCLRPAIENDEATDGNRREDYPSGDISRVKARYNIPRMPFRAAFEKVIDQSPGKKQWIWPRWTGGQVEQQMVGPLTGRYTQLDAVLWLLKTAYPDKDPRRILRFGQGNNWWHLDDPDSAAFRDSYYCDCDRWDPNLVSEGMLVTATRIPEDKSVEASSVSRMLIIDRDRIEAIGAASLPDLLKYLTQTSYTWNSGNDATGARHATGRGTGSALVLINSRRVFQSAKSLANAEFDLNTIPITAIERVEVLPDSGVTMHGLDAIGGVINIVLREHEGTQAEARFGSASGGALERRLSVSAGDGYDYGRWTVIADWYAERDLSGMNRDRYSNQNYTRFGGPDLRSTYSSPGNFQSMDGHDLPGLSSSFATIPPEHAPPLTVDDLILERNYTSLARYQSIVPARRKSTLIGTGYMTIGATSLAAEALYTREHTSYSLAPPSVPGLVLGAEHPQNPFHQPVIYEGLLTGIPTQEYQTNSKWLRVVLSAQGTIAGWQWTVSGVSSDESVAGWVTNVVDPLALMRSLSRGLDILSPTPGGPDLVAPRVTSEFVSKAAQLTGTAERSVAELPAGDVRLSVGVERRFESARHPLVDARRNVDSLFAQIEIPVIGPNRNLPAIATLSLLSGIRRERYEGIGSVTRAQHGIAWRPMSQVEVRGGWAQLYRVPSLIEENAAPVTIPMPAFDARRGETVVASVIGGGRAELEPTTALSRSLGISVSDDQGGWKISADFWRTDARNRIGRLSHQLILQNEAALSDRVLRDPPAPQDAAAGLPGRLRSIDTRLENLGALRASGVDLMFEKVFDMPGGRLTPRVSTTRINEFRVRDLPSEIGREVDRVGSASTQGTITRYRAIGALSWEAHRWPSSNAPVSTNVYIQHDPSYRDIGGTRGVKDQTTVDVSTSLHLWTRSLVLTFGAVNVFDSRPGYSAAGLEGHDPSRGELKGRFAYGTLQYNF